MEFNLHIGMLGEKSLVVSADNTAQKYGSGSVAVFATPAMVGLMEGAALDAVDSFLPPGMTTVGINLNINHTAATPLGMTVKAIAELTAIDGKRLTFKVTAYDEKEKIGEGTHERYIIQLEKFMQNVQTKEVKKE